MKQLYFDNYRRIIDAGHLFSPGVSRDKFMYGLVGVMAAHVEPEILTKILDQVSRDMNLVQESSRFSTSSAS